MKASTAFTILTLLAAGASSMPIQQRQEGECPCAVLDANKDLDKVAAATAGDPAEPVVQLVPGAGGPSLASAPGDVRTDKVFGPPSSSAQSETVSIPPQDPNSAPLAQQNGEGKDVTVHIPIDGPSADLPAGQSSAPIVPSTSDGVDDDIQPFAMGNPALRLARPGPVAASLSPTGIANEASDLEKSTTAATPGDTRGSMSEALPDADLSAMKPNAGGALVDGRPTDPVVTTADDAVGGPAINPPGDIGKTSIAPTTSQSDDAPPALTDFRTVGISDEIDASVVEAGKTVESALKGGGRSSGASPLNDAATGGAAKASQVTDGLAVAKAVDGVEETVSDPRIGDKVPADDLGLTGLNTGPLAEGTNTLAASLPSDAASGIKDDLSTLQADRPGIVSDIPGGSMSASSQSNDPAVQASAQTSQTESQPEAQRESEPAEQSREGSNPSAIAPVVAAAGDPLTQVAGGDTKVLPLHTPDEMNQPLSQVDAGQATDTLPAASAQAAKLASSSVDPASIVNPVSASAGDQDLPEGVDVAKSVASETPVSFDGSKGNGEAIPAGFTALGSLPSIGDSVAPLGEPISTGAIKTESSPLTLSNELSKIGDQTREDSVSKGVASSFEQSLAPGVTENLGNAVPDGQSRPLAVSASSSAKPAKAVQEVENDIAVARPASAVKTLEEGDTALPVSGVSVPMKEGGSAVPGIGIVPDTAKNLAGGTTSVNAPATLEKVASGAVPAETDAMNKGVVVPISTSTVPLDKIGSDTTDPLARPASVKADPSDLKTTQLGNTDIAGSVLPLSTTSAPGDNAAGTAPAAAQGVVAGLTTSEGSPEEILSPVSTSVGDSPVSAVVNTGPGSLQGIADGLATGSLPVNPSNTVDGAVGALSSSEGIVDLISPGLFHGSGKVLLGKKPVVPPVVGSDGLGAVPASVNGSPDNLTDTAQNDLAKENIETCRECVAGLSKPIDAKVADVTSVAQSDPLNVKPEVEQSVGSKTTDAKTFSPISPQCATAPLTKLPERTVPCATNFGGRVGNDVDLCIARDQLDQLPQDTTPCPDNMQGQVSDKISLLGRDKNDESWDMLDETRKRDVVGQYVRLCMIANNL